MLTAAQASALDTLRGYWLPRYVTVMRDVPYEESPYAAFCQSGACYTSITPCRAELASVEHELAALMLEPTDLEEVRDCLCSCKTFSHSTHVCSRVFTAKHGTSMPSLVISSQFIKPSVIAPAHRDDDEEPSGLLARFEEVARSHARAKNEIYLRAIAIDAAKGGPFQVV